MQNFQANLQKLEAADTQVLGVSMDSPFSNAAWAEKINVTFPLLSDWGGEVTRKYGLYDEKRKRDCAHGKSNLHGNSQP